MDVDEIIETFGGNARLAGLLGLGSNTISMWRSAGIPAARCLDLSELAQRLAKQRSGLPATKRATLSAITLEILMRSKPKAPAKATPSAKRPGPATAPARTSAGPKRPTRPQPSQET